MADKFENIQAVDFDFDGILNKVMSEGISRQKLLEILTDTQSLLVKLGSLETMSKTSREDIMIQARQSINSLFKEYKKISYDESLKVYKGNVKLLGDAIGKAFGKKFDIPNWDKINDTLMSEKFDALHYYLNRSVFMLDQRVTLFELEGKKQLQEQVVQRILQERGGRTYNDLLDDLLGMLNQHYPSGYIPLPVIRNGKREFRKISLDYYVETWINDVEGSVHHWAERSTYLKAGIDLVEIHTQEGAACPICSPEVGKIYSLSGADPDFKRMDFALPRHPNCDCYMVPAIADTQTLKPGDLPESYPGLKEMDDDVQKFSQEMGVPFSGFDVVQSGENPFMATTSKGNITLNDTSMGHLGGFNAYTDLKNALDKIKTDKRLSFNEFESLESLRHEFYHAKNKAHFQVNPATTNGRIMELLTDFSSRYQFPEFFRDITYHFNSKTKLSDEMISRIRKESYGYQAYVQRFHQVLDKLSINPVDIAGEIEDIVNSFKPDKIQDLADLLADNSKVGKKNILVVLGFMCDTGPDGWVAVLKFLSDQIGIK